MIRAWMIAMTMLMTTAAMAEEITLKDIVQGRFRGETMGAVRPMAGGETYAQLSKDRRRIVEYAYKTGREVGTLVDLDHAKGPKLEHIDGWMMSPDGRRVLLATGTKYIYRRSNTATYYIYTRQNNRLEPLSEGGPQQTPLFSPDGQQIAFVRDGNIFLVKLLYDNAEVQVTKDGRRNEVINGIPDWVNEEEFGHTRAMVFTAGGEQLVWVRYDERRVPMVTLLKDGNGTGDGEGTFSYKYPVAGESNARVSVWSYDILSRQTRQLQVPLGDDDYVPRLKAAAEAQQVVVFTLNRRQDCLRLYLANALSTVAKQIIEEKADRYVREEAISGIQVTDQHILLPSDRDGYMHLYLYNLNGQLLRQVDSGDYEVSDVYGYDERTGDTYYASHELHGATEQQVWVARKNGRRECLTPRAGWHTAAFSADYRYFLHSWSDLQTPAHYDLCAAGGKVLTTLIDNQQLEKELQQYTLGKRELTTITTADGTTLNAWVVKPAGFDPSRCYPVVMYQYGGPGSQQVKNQWATGMAGQGMMLEQYLCAQGFLCVCVDNRGTGGRGAEFEKCTYLKLGQLEARDQVEAALWLGQQPYVDRDRIAIWGWSYGGFNTLMSMSEGRGVFRAGIAIAPPTSWRFYDTIYTERYMRTPAENPAGYDDCPLSRAGQLHGALLLVHGMADDNVHLRNTTAYVEELIAQDKDYRQLVYPNRNHSITGGNTRQHLFRQCVTFLKRELRK